jgi:MFS transporter, PPP family, 3-phenylpropionic acid transporter
MRRVTAPLAHRDGLRSWLGLAGFYTASFAVLAVYMQFFPTWLCYERGFDKASIAIVLAGQTVARTFAGPLWAQHADRRADTRRVLLVLSVGSLGAFLLFGAAASVLAAFVVAFVFGCLYPPMHPILDAAAVQAGAEHGFSFGRLRMVGSVSFLIVILAVGVAVERHGNWLVYPLLAGGLVLTISAALGLARTPKTGHEAPPRSPWWELLRSRELVLLFVAAALIQGSHATFYNLSTVHWRDHGIGEDVAALLWGEGILAEIVVFFVAKGTLDRLRPTTLIVLGGAAAVVRWIVVGATTSVPILFAANWLHAFSFAVTYLGSIRALDRRVPAHQRSTAQGLLGAATSGFGMVVCGVTGGLVYDRFLGVAFHVMAVFAAVGAALAWAVRRRG